MQPVVCTDKNLPDDNRESRVNRERSRRCDSALFAVASREPDWHFIDHCLEDQDGKDADRADKSEDLPAVI